MESLSRSDLLDPETVRDLWEEAGERDDVGAQTPYSVWVLVTQVYGTNGNVFVGDVTAALDEFTNFSAHPNSMSLAFKDRLKAGPVDD